MKDEVKFKEAELENLYQQAAKKIKFKKSDLHI